MGLMSFEMFMRLPPVFIWYHIMTGCQEGVSLPFLYQFLQVTAIQFDEQG